MAAGEGQWTLTRTGCTLSVVGKFGDEKPGQTPFVASLSCALCAQELCDAKKECLSRFSWFRFLMALGGGGGFFDEAFFGLLDHVIDYGF